MGVVVTHPMGSPFASAVVRALIKRSLLDAVWTTLGVKEGSIESSLISSLFPVAKRRVWIPPEALVKRTGTSSELIRILTERSGLKRLAGLSSQRLIDWVYKSFDEGVATKLRHSKDTSGVYCYEDGARETFEVMKKLGARCFYDLPIPYYRKREELLQEESGFSAEPKWKKERKEAEALLADHIFVASTFSKSSLIEAGIPNEKISVIPYGVNLPSESKITSDSGRFNILYAGRIESRKGIRYLLEAYRSLKLKGASLTLIGINEDPTTFKSDLKEEIRFLGPQSVNELEAAYKNSDLFVFPTLFDGFGLVILEALSFGVPVIATMHSGAPDILTDGRDGFVIPPKRSDSIAEKMLWCYEHRDELRAMKIEARKTAAKFSWEEYENRIAEKISLLLRP